LLSAKRFSHNALHLIAANSRRNIFFTYHQTKSRLAKTGRFGEKQKCWMSDFNPIAIKHLFKIRGFEEASVFTKSVIGHRAHKPMQPDAYGL
jgi:hypothetical protein